MQKSLIMLLLRRFFEELSAEETKHEEILDNIITMVNRPNTWLMMQNGIILKNIKAE